MRTRRALLLLTAIAAIGAVAPAAADAGGAGVTVRIIGAGRVYQSAPAPLPTPHLDCKRGPGGPPCPEFTWGADLNKLIELKAEPATYWKFEGWEPRALVGGWWVAGEPVFCIQPGFLADTCGFKVGDCIGCVSHYTLWARFSPRDTDADGYPASDDCNDQNRDIHPGAADAPGDAVDQNCDGEDTPSPVDLDVDNDGYERSGPGATQPFDCNDNNKDINPGVPDVPDNGIDEDCEDGDAVDLDRDDDGYDRNEPGGKAPFDCNDTKDRINPGARDVPDNGIDENCEDGDAVDLDRDGDGYDRNEPGGKAPFDCDDTKDGINPGMVEVPDNGVDENCDGVRGVRLDRDGDGYDREEPGAKAPFDCDDGNGALNPGAIDKPQNGVDENCDGRDAGYPSVTSEVRYAVKSKRGFAHFRRLYVLRPPDGATVEVRCKTKRKGCPFARRRQIAAPGTARMAFGADLRRAELRTRAVLEVRITRSDMRGKLVRLTVRRGGKVTGVALCLAPGSKTPTGCPPG
jgi:hypothetical protein